MDAKIKLNNKELIKKREQKGAVKNAGTLYRVRSFYEAKSLARFLNKPSRVFYRKNSNSRGKQIRF